MRLGEHICKSQHLIKECYTKTYKELLKRNNKKRNSCIKKKKGARDFPGGPGVKHSCFMQGMWVWSRVRELKSHMLRDNQAHTPQLARTPHTHTKSLRTAVEIQPPDFLEINKKWAKHHGRLLTKEDVQVANKRVKKCSISMCLQGIGNGDHDERSLHTC